MNSVPSGRGAGRSTKHDGAGHFAKRATPPAFKGLNEKTWFFSMCLLGRSVTVKTTDGYTYKGMFYGMKETEQGEMHLILSHASRNDEKETLPYAIIPYNVFGSLAAEEVDLSGQDISATPFTAVAGFEDTANAFDSAGNERKLEEFVFDGNVADPGLEDSHKVSATGGWSGKDMFAENERRFGVTATFEESMYTTGLDGANISPEEAERLAQSILAEQGATAHEREERGQIDDSGLTEEDKYGAVLRQPAGRGPAPRPPAAPPAAPPPGPPPPEDMAELSPAALPPAAGGGSNGAARSERQEINAVRLKLAEGKSVQTAVDPQLRTKYINDAPGVDALNLMPGTGSHKFRKDKNAGVAHRLNDYKYKRQSSAGGHGGGVGKPAALAGPPGGGDAAPEAIAAPPAAPAAAPPAAPLAAPPAAPLAAPAVPAAAGDGAAVADSKPSTTMKFNPDAQPFSFNPKSAPFTPGKKAQEGSSSGAEGSGGGWGGRKGWQRERGDGVRGARGRPGRNHDGYHGPHGTPRQGGFMYQGHMGMPNMPSMASMIVSQPMPSGPRGTPIGQMPGGGYTPMPLHYGMPIPFTPQMAQMSQGMHPMPMNIGAGGYPIQPNMQPGYNAPTGQSPPNGYVPPNV